MASPSPSPVPARTAPAALTDELLEEIFLRLPTASDLARASTACVTFRRVIADHSFLRRFRALHPPPLLGITAIHFIPAEPPHPSAAAARAFAEAGAADFSCSFLPNRDRWGHRDFRDGRALLSAVPEGSNLRPRNCYPGTLFREFAVCDPLHRRYLLLPAIPDNLVALVHQPDVIEFDPLLAPASEDEGSTSFRVICLAKCETKLVVFVLSLGSRLWHAVAFDGWNNLTTGSSNLDSGFSPAASKKYFPNGCFCWVMYKSDKLLVLDTRSMELSGYNLPTTPRTDALSQYAIVEAGEERLGMFTLCSCIGHETYYLWYTILQKDVQGANKWQFESQIPLPLNFRYNIMGVAGGYLLLHGIAVDHESPNFDCFSLNLKTLQLEWFCKTAHAIIICLLYAGFPPPLSPPTI